MKFYNGLVESLQEALKDAKGEIKLSKTKVTIKPIVRFTPDEIRNIRISNDMTQSVFAGYLGVSNKTIEAWESGHNNPTGPACRLLELLKNDQTFKDKYPFVSISHKM